MLLTRSIMDRPDAVRFATARLIRYVPAIFVSALVAAVSLGPAATKVSLLACPTVWTGFAGGAVLRALARLAP